jgi:RNA recognition motif.
MSLFVGNVSRNVSEKDLEKAFSKYGDCKLELRVIPSRRLRKDYRETMVSSNLPRKKRLKRP